MTTSTRITLAQIFANVAAAKSAERSNETAFIGEMMAHSGNTQNVVNVSFYLNAMSVQQLGSMGVFREFIAKFTNFDVDYATTKTKVLSDGSFIDAKHGEYERSMDYKSWFRAQLVAAGLTADANASDSAIIYVCRGFKKRPADAKSDAEPAVVANRIKAQAEWDERRAMWDNFKAGNAIDVVVGVDKTKQEGEDGYLVRQQISDYAGSIICFMSKLATLVRSHKLSQTKATKTDAEKLADAKAQVNKALAALAKLEGGKAAVKAVLVEALQDVMDIGNGYFVVSGRTAQGGSQIPVVVTRTEEGHYVQMDNDVE